MDKRTDRMMLAHETGYEALARAVIVQAADDHYRTFFEVDTQGFADPLYLFWAEASGMDDENIEPMRRRILRKLSKRHQGRVPSGD